MGLFNLFKDGDELFDNAMESIKRGNYGEAKDFLLRAIDKNATKTKLAAAIINFLNMQGATNSSMAYRHLRDSLVKLGGSNFKVGLKDFDREQLIKECDAMIAQIDANSIKAEDENSKVCKAKALINAAKIMQMNIGQNSLKITEYFTKNVQSGDKIYNTMFAEANELLAESEVHHDIKKAMEYQQNAFNYRLLLGETGEKNQILINNYIASCTCWFCGRVAIGDGINFVKMDCDMIPREGGTDFSRSVDEKNSKIFVCNSCYTAFSGRADEISMEYYKEAIREMRRVEERINMRLAAIEGKIGVTAAMASYNMRN